MYGMVQYLLLVPKLYCAHLIVFILPKKSHLVRQQIYGPRGVRITNRDIWIHSDYFARQICQLFLDKVIHTISQSK